jgi:hypothetical protein
MRRLLIALVFVTAAFAASTAHASQYGFSHPPYSYSDEYRANSWRCSEAHRYQPGYHRCGGHTWRPYHRTRWPHWNEE